MTTPTPPASTPPARNPRKTIMLLALAALVLIAAMALPQLKSAGVGYSQEVREFKETSLVPFDGETFETALQNTAGRPTLLFLYASWCPYCKQQIGALKAISQRFSEKDLQILYVSLDQNPYDLSRFLLEEPRLQAFTPYHVTQDKAWVLIEYLNENHNTTADGSVPHTAIFNAQGTLVEEALGFTSAYKLQQIIAPLTREGTDGQKPN